MIAESVLQNVFQMPQIAVIMGCLIPIAGIVGGVWYKARRVQSDNELKRLLVERGMSVEEIERIIAAGRGCGDDDD